jgi:hypothetical protein
MLFSVYGTGTRIKETGEEENVRSCREVHGGGHISSIDYEKKKTIHLEVL